MEVRPLPYNLEAEAGVIGTLFNNSQAIDTVLEILCAEDFYDSKHRIIFKAMEELAENGSAIDLLTVGDMLQSRLIEVGGITYLTELMSSYFSTANVKEHSLIVKDKSNRRKLIQTANGMIAQAYEDTDTEEIINEVQDQLLKVNSYESSDVHSIFDIATTVFEELDRNYQEGGGLVGLSTGIDALDKMLMGMKPADYIIVAARPSMGKTALMLTLANNVARGKTKTVLMFSLEMTKENLVTRMFSSASQIPLERIKGARVTDEEWGILGAGVNRLTQGRIFIDDDAGLSVPEMRNKCKMVKHDHGLDFIIIDYIGKIRPTGRSNSRNEEISRISGALKDLAKEMKCPVVALSQLSRACEARPDHRPMLSDLRESGSIEQDADVVLMLYRDEYYNKETEDKNILETIVTKNRDGKTGTVKLYWNGNTQTIAGLDLTYEGKYNPKTFGKE